MIAQNASLHQWGTLFNGWAHDFWGLHDTPQVSGYWRPMATMVHVILTQIFGTHAGVFHFFNLLLHLCNAYLFYLFLLNIGFVRWTWIPVLFFLWHPLSAETVGFNSAIPDLLSAFFGWFAVVLWTGKNRTSSKSKTNAVLFLILSYLSKESGAFFGLFVIGIDWILYRDEASKKMNTAIIAASLVIYAGLHKLVVHGFGARDPWGGDWSHHFATVFKLMITQLALLIVPVGSTPVRDFSVVGFSNPWAWIGLLLLVALIGLFFYFFKKKSAWAFVIFFYLVFWFPVSNIIPAEGLIVDRYMYVISMAMALAIGMLCNDFEKPDIIALVLIGYGVWAMNNALVWKNSETLWAHAIKKSSTSSVAWNEWGNVLSSKQKYQEAYDAYKRAVGLQPKYRDASYNQSFALVALKDPQAKDTIEKHLSIFPNDAQALDLLGSVHEMESNNQLALDYSHKAVEAAPNHWKYRYNLGEIYYRMNKFDLAAEQFKFASQLSPGHFEVVKNLAAAYCMNGQYKECLNTYREFTKRFPNHAQDVSVEMDKANKLLELTQGK